MSLLLDLLKFAREAPHHPIVAIRLLFASEWARFGLIGVIASFVYYVCGLLLVSWLRINLLLGNTLAFIISFLVSYIGQSYWTFKSERPVSETLPRFALTQGVGLFFNSFIIENLCNRFHWPYPLAMLAAIMIVPVATYLVFKFWVFKKRVP